MSLRLRSAVYHVGLMQNPLPYIFSLGADLQQRLWVAYSIMVWAVHRLHMQLAEVLEVY